MTSFESCRINDVFGPIVGGKHKEDSFASNPTASHIQLPMREAGLREVKACNLEGLT